MNRLSARHVGELAVELASLLRSRRLRTVQPLPPRDLLLVFEGDGEGGSRVLRVRVSVDADAPRIHLQHGRVHSYDGPPGPFFRRLAEELEGLELSQLEQVRGDRIVRLVFQGERRRVLFVELAGRHGNLILTDGSERVLEVLVANAQRPSKRPTPGKADRPPRLKAGEPWTPPPGLPPADAGPELQDAWPEPGDALPEFRDNPAPLSRRVEDTLGQGVAERDIARERRSLRERLARKLKAATSRVSGLARRRDAVDGAERVRQDGELLKSYLGQIRRGADSVEVQDWFEDGSPRRIALDPKRSPAQNLERLFARYQKLVRSRAALDDEERLARSVRDDLASLLARIDEADPVELEREAIKARHLKPRQAMSHRDGPARTTRLPYKRFVAVHGTEIRVGRNARDNDALCTRYARGNDLWLHTRDAPGSHVILRLERGREPDPEEVLDAAHLAIHFSPLKDAGRAAVHVARRKEVHKPRGAPAGLVTLSGGRTLDVRLEPQRLSRLMARKDA